MTERISKAALGLLLLWVPLAFYARSAEGFTLPKEFIGLAALGILAGTAWGPGARALLRQPLTLVMGLFTLWMAGDALLVSGVKSLALAGMAHLLLLSGTLFAVVFLCARGLSYVRLLHYALGAGFLMSLYGLVQGLGMDPTHWTTGFSRRAFATLGNPDYLGGHLAALLPLAAVLALRSTGRTVWLVWRLGVLVLFFALVLTRVRGAEIAAAAAFLFILAAFARPWGRDLFKRNRRTLAGILGVALVAGGLVFFWRGNALFTGAGESLAQREAIYRTAWEIVKDHPVVGVGLGQLGPLYPSYQWRPYAPQDYPDHPYVYTEHVHDEYLQFWVEGGAVGLALFLAGLAAFAWSVRRTLASPQVGSEAREVLLGACAGVVALLAQALSNFPFQVAPTAVLFGLLLAAPLALRPASVPPTAPPSAGRAWTLALVLLVGAAAGIRLLAGSIAARDAAGEASLGNGAKASYYAGRLTSLLPWDAKAWNLAGHAWDQAGEPGRAYPAFQRSLSLDPGDVEDLMAMADLEARKGEFQQALDLAERALAAVPNDVGPLWVRAYCRFQLKQWGPAADSFHAFLAYAPQSPDAWTGLGVCDIHLGKKSEAVAAWRRALQLEPGNAQLLGFLKGAGAKPF